MDGWVKINRELSHSEIWNLERYSRGQAWVDLRLLANHQANTFFIRGIEIDLKPGQLAFSQVTLAHKWKWNERTVRSFLSWLEKRQMIQSKTNNVCTVITILDYPIFNNSTEQNTLQNTEQNTERVQNKIQTNKNDKNEKKINTESKKTIKPTSIPEYLITLPEEDIVNFIQKHSPLTREDIQNESDKAYHWVMSDKKHRKDDYKHFFHNWLRRILETRLPVKKTINGYSL